MSDANVTWTGSGKAVLVGLLLTGWVESARAQEAETPAGEETAPTSDAAPDASAADSQPDPNAIPTEGDAPEATTPSSETDGAPDGQTAEADASAELAVSTETAATDAVVKEEKKESSWTDHIKLKGDFRYRFEILDTDTEGSDLRYRHRIRARVGVIGQVVDDLEIGVQMATGSEDPVSTNQTLDNAFSTKPFWLDLGYAAYHPSWAEGLALIAGKMKNPFLTVGKSELIWDPDLTPEGIALGYKNEFGIAEPFVQTAGFFVEERSSDDDSWILGVQGGLKLTFLDGMLYVLGGAGYIDHTNIEGSEVYFDSTDAFGNSSELADPDSYDPTDPDADDPELVYVNDYNLVEGFLEIGGKAWKYPWAVFATLVSNTGADDDNLGWLVGAKYGKVKKFLDFDIRYIYRQVEKDAVVGLFTDSDFLGGGTDGTGHEFNLGFGLAKNVKLAATYFLNERGISDNVDYGDGAEPDTDTEIFHRFQLDFKFKF